MYKIEITEERKEKGKEIIKLCEKKVEIFRWNSVHPIVQSGEWQPLIGQSGNIQANHIIRAARSDEL